MRYALIAATLVVSGVASAKCLELPDFKLDTVNYEASHVVLARVDPKTEKLEVLESWRGDLARGAHVPIEALAKTMADERRGVLVEGHVTHHEVSSDRAVFFLVKRDEKFIPAAWLYTSCVWLDGGKLYAYRVSHVEGMTELGMNETALHAAVATAGDLRARVEKARATADPGARAKALVELHAETTGWLRDQIDANFTTCPKESARELARLLARRSNLDDHAGALVWIQRLDRDEGLAASRAIVKEELARWKKIAPTLAHSPSTEERQELDARIARLTSAIYFVRPTEKMAEIDELREVFQSKGLANLGAVWVLRAIDPPCECTK